MNRTRNVGSALIGDGQPVYIMAEIGINHNGSLDNAIAMIDGALQAGANCVKFQKRTPSYASLRINGSLNAIPHGVE